MPSCHQHLNFLLTDALAVNVASRMESTSTRDMIQCSESFMDLLQQQWPEAARLAAPQVCVCPSEKNLTSVPSMNRLQMSAIGQRWRWGGSSCKV
eukprot:1141533-Pelagomonas_calceolata.AAC.6